LYRDESTLESIGYYHKLPDGLGEADVFLVDPMLATGGSAIEALRLLHEAGAERVRLLVLVAVPVGLQAVHERWPGLHIHTASLDRELNEKGYILPGLGDAGDRLFGTR
jgi:uracil phosphoribosyltransferase